MYRSMHAALDHISTRPVQVHGSRKEPFYPSHTTLQKQLSNHHRAHSGSSDGGWTNMKAERFRTLGTVF